MKFKKEDVSLLAGAESCNFEKEGALFIQEKVEGFFKRNESNKSALFVKFYSIWLLLITLVFPFENEELQYKGLAFKLDKPVWKKSSKLCSFNFHCYHRYCLLETLEEQKV